jgi:AcrR family transcriptional regulator
LERDGLQSLGLRERKKAKTRSAIQSHALRLFREQGYDATTVQQIIQEAEVSESTFFRYFPTKADVVLFDDVDPLMVEAFRTQPPELSPLQALRGAFRDAFAQLSAQEIADQMDRMQLSLSVPELRAVILDQFAGAMQLLAEVLAERTGRRADDLSVSTLAGAVVGVAIAVMFSIADDPTRDIVTLFDESMACLDKGFDL